MSDLEFDLLDELYFVQDFAYLKATLRWEEETLVDTLHLLFEKGWIKCFTQPDQECFGEVDLRRNGKDLLYLATKKGLMAHTTL